MVEDTSQTVIGTTSYALSVGAGGASNQNGGNSILNVNSNVVKTAIGGGGGGHGGDGTPEDGTDNPYGPGKNGGSGGGGYLQGQGTSGQGFAGGLIGGGGGAGGVAPDSDGNGGNGGIGRQSSITGTAIYYAGGGAGVNGIGGLGGGGSSGESGAIPGTNGLGGGGAPGYLQGLSGGSGVIILRFPSFTTAFIYMDITSVSSTSNDIRYSFRNGGGTTTMAWTIDPTVQHTLPPNQSIYIGGTVNPNIIGASFINSINATNHNIVYALRGFDGTILHSTGSSTFVSVGASNAIQYAIQTKLTGEQLFAQTGMMGSWSFQIVAIPVIKPT
jgi:hypothetical protein